MFKLASKDEGMDLISQIDDFICRLTPNERAFKMGVTNKVSQEVFLNYLRGCVLEFHEDEMKRLTLIDEKVTKTLHRHSIKPIEIYLVKTNGKDEWDSAYTRGNVIYLPVYKLNNYDEEGLLKLMLHEFFHVYFRNHPNKQEDLYQIIGYHLINEIKIPNHFLERKLTNPDAPYFNRVIQLTYNSKLVQASPIVLLKEKSKAHPKDIMDRIEIMYFIDQECISPYEVSALDILGENTKGQLDPDEILAENFVFMILGTDVPTMRIIDEMRKIIIGEKE